MNEERLKPVASQPDDPIEALLGSLIDCEEVHLVVKNEAASAELRGRASLDTGDQWLTIKIRGGPDHVHVRRGVLVSGEFLLVPGKNRGVRFFGSDRQLLITCYLPGTNEEASAYSLERRHAFDRIEAAHRRAPWRLDQEGTP